MKAPAVRLAVLNIFLATRAITATDPKVKFHISVLSLLLFKRNAMKVCVVSISSAKTSEIVKLLKSKNNG